MINTILTRTRSAKLSNEFNGFFGKTRSEPGDNTSARLTPDERQFMVAEVPKRTPGDLAGTSNPPHWSNGPQARI
jgi:hypothetical protein